MDKEEYLLIPKRMAFVFLFYVATRLLFYFFNLSYFSNIISVDLFFSFLYGTRFDLSTLLIASIPFVLLSVIPFRNKAFNLIIKLSFVIMHSLFLAVNIIDVEFFKFNGKKLTVDILNIGADISAQIIQLCFYYWYLVFFFLITLALLWNFYPRAKKSIFLEKKINLLFTPFIGILIVSLTFVGIRGGLQMRSISPKEAFIFKTYEQGNLAINSAYTLVRSLDKKGLEVKKYFSTDKKATDYILSKRSFSRGYTGVNGKNIVIIIIESLAQEYVDEGYAPFFSKLSKSGMYFSKNFANGRRSIEVLPSILVGMPSIIGKPIYQSQYQTNKFIGLPQLLKNIGYHTSFFHGGKKGTMDFDAYVSSVGVDHYFAKEDYPEQAHYDGNWGIYDHHFFNFMIDNIDAFSKPFFSTFFSLSSHQPYSVPGSLKNNFPKGELEIHQSIGYADYSLKQFFGKIKDKDWYQDTLFIITADHTQKSHSSKFRNTLGQYRVPLLLFSPSEDLSKFKSRKISQHVDVMPSVLDFLNLDNYQGLLYGTSVFGKDSGRMINFIGGQYLYFKDGDLLKSQGEQYSLFRYDDKLELESSLEDESVLTELKSELNAYVQLTFNGLIFNSIYNH